jgi:cytidine deaminase
MKFSVKLKSLPIPAWLGIAGDVMFGNGWFVADFGHSVVLWRCGGGALVPLEIPRSASQHMRVAKRRARMSLSEAARKVRENAHAPYSNFKVGAAIRASSGAVYIGCNVENVAYPEGTCAEAGAIAAMVAAGDTAITEAYVIADSPTPVPPCGGCRQKLAEFAKGNVRVTLATVAGGELVTTVGDLLPGAFGASHMENS